MIDFNEMIHNFLSREQRAKTIGRYYPSEIGMCMRKTWLSYKYPTELKPELLKIFQMGNIIHDFVVDVLKSEKNPDVELLKSEFPFKEEIDDFLISGRVDNLILLKMSGKNVLIEVKSTSDTSFVREASSHNIAQLQLYMHFTGVRNGMLLYVGKKDLQSKVFVIDYDEKQALEIVERFKKLHACLTKEVMPDPEARETNKTNWMCRFCEYKDKCYAETPSSSKWL